MIASHLRSISTILNNLQKFSLMQGVFNPIKEIGKGSFANVYSARVEVEYKSLPPGTIVAIKKISTAKFSTPQEKMKLENEISLMQTLNHENIVKLYGVERRAYDYYLVMEYCEGGDLIHFLKNYPEGLPQNLLQNFGRQIGNGLKYLAAHEIIHRDLKPHNILIRGEGENIKLKIADFGFARFLRPTDLADSVCGSPIYMAPEIHFKGQYSAPVDMWSIGVILYELATTKPPYPNARLRQDLEMELRNQGSHPITIPKDIKVCREFRDLVQRLLTIDTQKRITINEYLDHPFFKLHNFTNPAIPPDAPSRHFSFYGIIGTTIDPDTILDNAMLCADAVESVLSDCQTVGEGTHLELLVSMIEFLLDIVEEAEGAGAGDKQVAEKISLVMERAASFREEAMAYNETGAAIEAPSVTGLQYLLNRGLSIASEGLDDERDGDFEIAEIKYRRALALLQPLACISGRDDDIARVREICRQLSQRINRQ